MNQDPTSNPVPPNPVAPVDTTLEDEGKPKVLPAIRPILLRQQIRQFPPLPSLRYRLIRWWPASK